MSPELAGELDRVHRRRDALATEIEEVFLAHPFGELLVSLPGIGPRTGARILAEIGDGGRFANGSKLASYAGLAPVTRQSGKSLNGESKSRRGNHRLKNAMFLAAFASLRSPDSKTFYDRKRAEGKDTTPPSSASPDAAATSSSPCSATAPPTTPAAPSWSMPPELPEPWFAPSPSQARDLEHEARAEIGPVHELAGRHLTTIAKCSGCDHVLFRLDDDTWAIVHLTWSHKTEPTPWPATDCYGGFLAIEMAVDAHQH